MDGFLAVVKMFAGSFAPRGWAYCHGQILPIQNNTALFSLMGNTYGGDGRTTMGLPDLKGRVNIGSGQGLGLSSYYIRGNKGGYEMVSLTEAQIPVHSHSATVSNLKSEIPFTQEDGDESIPSATNIFANGTVTKGRDNYGNANIYKDTASSGRKSIATEGNISIGDTGGSQPHANIQPFSVVDYVICLDGQFPARN